MGTYTIRQATPTGKNDPTYGAEYIVHFNEDEREVKMSRKQPVTVGQTEDGTIVDGKYGAYFKKAPYNPNRAQAPAAAAPAPRTPYKRTDNSDGQRQGMCLNNAANYVNAKSSGQEPVDFDTWAKTVFAYAQALYSLGNLSAEAVASPVAAETPIETITGIFGVQQ
jgi:hypothetical protein